VKAPTLEELALLPEPVALQRNFDAKNFRLFRVILVVVGLASLGGLALSLGGTVSAVRVAFYALSLLVVLACATLYREPFFARYFRHILVAYLFLQVAAGAFWTMHTGDGLIQLVPLFPLFFVFFRLHILEHLLLFGTFWVAQLFSPIVTTTTPPPSPLEQGFNLTLGITLATVTCFVVAVLLTQLDRRRFLEIWRREQSRSRERLRIREEIEYARKIQLSMLPQGAPDFTWLDFSSASLPATEVGGDYYDYFRLPSGGLALVIADVAGHGLASGLLLSGVRSCLYMLEDELANPIAVFQRLNRMVRRTGARRTYVTMVLAVIDPSATRLVLTSAGHPPVLHWRAATRTIDEVGRGALPLGTGLEPHFEQEERTLGRDDVLLLYTDGLIETRNERGDDYGEKRLRQALARAASARSAREIRDSMLSELANFKGNVEQADDITLVVARLR
jgi:serine phosphatase RsbU (regulator of sigma subunit)